MRFLVDAQLPPTLARWLRESGYDAIHTVDVNLRDADDSVLWRYALENHFILISKDEDFAERVRQGQTSPVIVWLRVGNVSNQFLRQWFLPQLPQIIEWLDQGARFLEIR